MSEMIRSPFNFFMVHALVAAWYAGSGCASSPPTYVKAEVASTHPPRGSQRQATVVTDKLALAMLISAMPPGVGIGRRSPLAVGGIQSHRIRLTRASGKVDRITIYNGGSAWSEGRGDWPLDDAEREELSRWLASIDAGQLK